MQDCTFPARSSSERRGSREELEWGRAESMAELRTWFLSRSPRGMPTRASKVDEVVERVPPSCQVCDGVRVPENPLVTASTLRTIAFNRYLRVAPIRDVNKAEPKRAALNTGTKTEKEETLRGSRSIQPSAERFGIGKVTDFSMSRWTNADGKGRCKRALGCRCLLVVAPVQNSV